MVSPTEESRAGFKHLAAAKVLMEPSAEHMHSRVSYVTDSRKCTYRQANFLVQVCRCLYRSPSFVSSLGRLTLIYVIVRVINIYPPVLSSTSAYHFNKNSLCVFPDFYRQSNPFDDE